MSRENIGHVLIAFICCVGPLIWASLGIAVYKRYQRRGISGFIPKIRTEALHR